jgi:thiol-disulfide isomerase/thioredoxin
MIPVSILYFYTDWCAPALRLRELFSELKPVKKYPIDIRFVDADKKPGIKKKYRVKLIPTTLFLKKGREVKRLEGAWHLNKYQEILSELS